MQLLLGQKVHICWIIAGAAAGILVGVGLAAVMRPGLFAAPMWLCIALAAFGSAAIRPQLGTIILAIAAGLLLGMWRGSSEQFALSHYAPFYGKTVTLAGTVSEDTAYGPSGDQRIRLGDISVDGQPVHGQVWVSTLQHTDIQRSDRLTVRGAISKGFGNMPASMYYAEVSKVERPQPGDVALHVRNWFAGGIRKAIPDPQASLGAGYLIGQRSSLPTSLDAQLKMVGLTHAVVASGYNLTILVAFARRRLLKTSKYLATLAASLMILSFILVTGLSPSMTRAGLVTGLSLAAWYYGRRLHPLILLPVAAALTVLWNPSYVWGDIGWYLSFTSFAGILLLAPLLQSYFWGKQQPRAIPQIIIETTSAQLATLPIMIFSFGQYSVYALLANLLVLPLIPLTMVLTFIAGIAGVTFPALAHLVGLPATIILQYMTTVVDRIANLPGAQGTISFTVLILILSYAALTGLIVLLQRKTAYRFRDNNNVIGGSS